MTYFVEVSYMQLLTKGCNIVGMILSTAIFLATAACSRPSAPVSPDKHSTVSSTSLLPKGTSWDESTGVFVWRGGQATFPIGFSYQTDRGVDSFAGHFTSKDGTVVVHHDIGFVASAGASGGEDFKERIVDDSRVWTAHSRYVDNKGRSWIHVVITFPDAGCANFYTDSQFTESAWIIERIGQTFRPRGKMNAADRCPTPK